MKDILQVTQVLLSSVFSCFSIWSETFYPDVTVLDHSDPVKTVLIKQCVVPAGLQRHTLLSHQTCWAHVCFLICGSPPSVMTNKKNTNLQIFFFLSPIQELIIGINWTSRLSRLNKIKSSFFSRRLKSIQIFNKGNLRNDWEQTRKWNTNSTGLFH